MIEHTLFVNPNGILCKTIVIFNRPLFTMIDVIPEIDGYDVSGKIINIDDWSYNHH